MNKQDPRITAYLLGELSEKEKESFEKELNQFPEIQKLIQELRQTSESLEDFYKSQKQNRLSPQSRNHILEKKKKTVSFWKWLTPVSGLVAASLAVFIFLKTDPGLKKDNLSEHDTIINKLDSSNQNQFQNKQESERLNAKYLPQPPQAPTQKSGLYNTSNRRPAYVPQNNFGSVTEGNFNTEAYDFIQENGFILSQNDPLSTFSVDVDTASYANLRRFLNQGSLPPKDAIRIEEMINYFDYDYPKPIGKVPFSAHIETASSPWNKSYRLAKIGIKAKDIPTDKRPSANLVFLLDVSGSMMGHQKLPLLKKSFRLLVNQLGKKDRISIVTYAGASGLALEATEGSQKNKILDSLERLQAGGSTNGGEGIQLAYKVAQDNFIKDGINRVILATDGDFNVGVSHRGDLTRLIQEKAKTGITLSILGFGMGNYKDSSMEELSNKGNGNYAYIDSLKEANKVLVEEMMGTLAIVAKDVKIQVEFNPSQVQAYRLVGYENRIMAHQDFNDDKKDAGDIGAGHTVTALYEIVPQGIPFKQNNKIDDLKYQKTKEIIYPQNKELFTLKLRYKKPDSNKSQLIELTHVDTTLKFEDASDDFRFASSVASFGMLLRESEFLGDLKIDQILQMAQKSKGKDLKGYRAELAQLISLAKSLR